MGGGDHGRRVCTFVEDVAEVGYAFEVFKGGAAPDAGTGGAKGGFELGAELGVHSWVAGEEVEGPADEASGGVAAGEEDIEPVWLAWGRCGLEGGVHLVAEGLGVAGVLRHSVEEDVFLLGFFRKRELVSIQGHVDISVNKAVDAGVDLLHSAGGPGDKLAPAHAPNDPLLSLIESVGKVGKVVGAGNQRVGALTKQKLGGGIQRQSKEPRL